MLGVIILATAAKIGRIPPNWRFSRTGRVDGSIAATSAGHSQCGRGVDLDELGKTLGEGSLPMSITE
jgi:hypothetical protein